MPKHLFAAVRLLALAMLLFTLAPASSARAQDDLDISVFYDELEEHGRWFTHPRYGYVWSPDVEDDDWRPYSRGHWIYTDDHGWYWQAEESWGWGPFHYGRWILDDDYGWVWIPGTEWGPAWVAWRSSDEYVGWAPLPPEAEWYEDRGLTFSASYYDAPQFAPLWIFIEPRYLVLPGLYRHALPRSRNIFALGRTRWHTDYRFVNRRIFNTGFDVRRFERITRRPLVRVRLVTSDSPRSRGFRGNDRGTLHTFRPKLAAGARPPRPPRLVDPPRRGEPRRRDGGGRPVVRPGFTPQDMEKGGSTRERGIAAPPGGGSPKGDDDNIRRKGFRGPDDDQRKDSARRPREEQFKQRPPGEASGGPPKGDDDNIRRKGFRSPDDDQRKDSARWPREEQFKQRPPGEASGGPPSQFKQQQLKQPKTGLQTPPGQPGGSDRQQKQFKPPQAGQPPPRARTETGSSPPQQFKQHGAPPQGRGSPPPQRGGDRRNDDAVKKGKQRPEQKDGTVPR